MGKVIVAALGGSLIKLNDHENCRKWIAGLIKSIMQLNSQGFKVGIVVGGGIIARQGISSVRDIIKDNQILDNIGILATRLNATLIQQAFDYSGIDICQSIPTDITSAAKLLEQHSVVVMGGTVPGQTTDTVAVELSNSVDAKRCVIATNVSYVYDKDPRSNEDAKIIKKISLKDLGIISGIGKKLEAGSSKVVDPIAIERAIEGKMPLCVVNGWELEQFMAAMSGRDFNGTTVTVY